MNSLRGPRSGRSSRLKRGFGTIAVIAEARAARTRLGRKRPIGARTIRCRPRRIRPLHPGLAIAERLVAEGLLVAIRFLFTKRLFGTERFAAAARRTFITRRALAPAIAAPAESLSGMAAGAAGAARGVALFLSLSRA